MEILKARQLICWSTGPTVPNLSKNNEIILQNVGQLALVNLLFSTF